MKWLITQTKLGNWARTFVWFPTHVKTMIHGDDGTRETKMYAWLEHVERRAHDKAGRVYDQAYGGFIYYRYRPLGDNGDGV